jgi:Ni,Fe-hydrogenase III large subunit
VTHFRSTRNAIAVPRAEVPELSVIEWSELVVGSGARLAALFGEPLAEGATRLWAVLAFDSEGALGLSTTQVNGAYPALTPDLFQAHLFERALFEDHGVVPRGHPWLKPVRFTRPGALPAVDDFFVVEGEAIHEVAVGPVHAGVIEPGHFRFQCHGERVLHLEIALGYQHRGVRRALIGGPHARSVHQLETLAGDTSAGHATAHAQVLEGLAHGEPGERALRIRAIALELERLANHTGDLGALAGDIGYLPAASFFGRLRGEFLNQTLSLCGSRLGRGWVRPGGVRFGVDRELAESTRRAVTRALGDVDRTARLLFDTPSVLARFEETGKLSTELANALGMVGPAARASGVDLDVRRDFPNGPSAAIPVVTVQSGDVQARALVRWREIQHSARFVLEQLERELDGGDELCAPLGALAPDACVVSLIEGWRGEICHVVLTDQAGRFERYEPFDPSFHNWIGLALAVREQQISDFPLCNKSFNLSYAGHDL